MKFLELSGPTPAAGAGGTLELVTLAEFLAFASLQSDSGPNDARAQVMLDGIHWRVFQRTGGRFIKTQATDFDHVYARESGSRKVDVQQFPIVSVTSIDTGYMDGEGSFTATQALTTSDYFLDKASGLVVLIPPAPSLDVEYNTRIQYKAGWSAAPQDLKNAIMAAASIALEKAARNRWDVSSSANGSTQDVFSALWWRHGTLDTAEFTQGIDTVLEAYTLEGADIAAF